MVDLSWAGRLADRNPALAAITKASVGDPVTLVSANGAWLIKNSGGETLGRMAHAWTPPQGRTFLCGKVGAIVRWRKADNKEEYRDHLRREEWEVVLPELTFCKETRGSAEPALSS